MNLSKLPIGTKLMWDVAIPFEGYHNENPDYPGGIVYPVMVGEHHGLKSGPQKDMRILYTSDNNGQWTIESDSLREPTPNELLKFTWPTSNLIKNE